MRYKPYKKHIPKFLAHGNCLSEYEPTTNIKDINIFPELLHIFFFWKKYYRYLQSPHPSSLSPLSLLTGSYHPKVGIYIILMNVFVFTSYVSSHKHYLSLFLCKWSHSVFLVLQLTF